jgi:hypothetical protein
MEIEPHPYISKHLTRLFYTFFCVFALLLFLSHAVDEKYISTIVPVALIGGCSFFIYVFYRLKNVRCPKCRKNTIASKISNPYNYSAQCINCQIEWDLGIGYGNN